MSSRGAAVAAGGTHLLWSLIVRRAQAREAAALRVAEAREAEVREPHVPLSVNQDCAAGRRERLPEVGPGPLGAAAHCSPA